MEFSLIDESIATTQSSIIMEVYHHPHLRVDNTDFFPVEHPLEPPDEDRPVKCPMPESSVISVSMCYYSFSCYLVILRWQSMFAW